MIKLKTCPTPWCNSKSIHTTSFHTSKEDKVTKEVRQIILVEHICKDCGVRTPRLPANEATKVWNGTLSI